MSKVEHLTMESGSIDQSRTEPKSVSATERISLYGFQSGHKYRKSHHKKSSHKHDKKLYKKTRQIKRVLDYIEAVDEMVSIYDTDDTQYWWKKHWVDENNNNVITDWHEYTSVHDEYVMDESIRVMKQLISEPMVELKTAYIFIEHDGYDSYGPRTVLYDLYIVYKKNKIYYLTEYHMENWFSIRDENFYLYETTLLFDYSRDYRYYGQRIHWVTKVRTACLKSEKSNLPLLRLNSHL